MKSFLKILIEHLVPRCLQIAEIRARGSLFLGIRAVEQSQRQNFFYNAFKALSFNRIEGDYLEFGCHGGMTFALAYHESRRHSYPVHLWGFDSFTGLPSQRCKEDEHPKWQQGEMVTSIKHFHYTCKSNSVPRHSYTVVPGFYEETLEKISPKDPPNSVCLAYVDCDLYSSTKCVLKFLMPRLKHGMIIAFDDYYCWSGTQVAGERRAMLEFFENNERWRLLPYIQYGWHGASFVVEARDLL